MSDNAQLLLILTSCNSGDRMRWGRLAVSWQICDLPSERLIGLREKASKSVRFDGAAYTCALI
jgi:hypothetical protein